MKGTHTRKRVLFMAATYFVVLVLSLAASSHVAFAANDASLTLSPADGTYTVGDQLTVTVGESSTASDNTQAVFVTLMYSDTLLQYMSSSQGTFPSCDIQQTVSGEVDISCSPSSPVGGTQTVASITFKVLAAGAPSVSVDPSSDIQDVNGNSVWDGNIAVSSYTANAPASTSGGTGGSTSRSSAGSSGSTAGSSSSISSGSSTGGSSSSSSSQAPGAAGNQSTTRYPVNSASLTLVVTDTNNHNISGAKITVDGKHTAYTNEQGELVLNGLSSGAHTLAVAAPGKQQSTTTISLTAGDNKIVALKLTDQVPSLGIYPYIIIGITIVGVVAYIMMKRGGFSTWQRHPQQIMPEVVIGSGMSVVEPTPNPTPVTRHRFAISKFDQFDESVSAGRPSDHLHPHA